MRRLLPLLLLLAAGLAGCVEAEEQWTFDGTGGGTYRLLVRWDADLWRRVGDVLGPAVMARLAQERIPLTAAAWRDTLRGLEGVEAIQVEEGDAGGGLRRIEVAVRFRRLTDLVRWEWIAGRTLHVEGRGAREGGPPEAVDLRMEPLARVPVLDRLAALLEAVEHPPPPAPEAARTRDAGPLERFGIERQAGELVHTMVKPALERVRLGVRVTTPGRLVQVAGRTVSGQDREAAFSWDFAALRDPRRDRGVRLGWRLRSRDVVPEVHHEGPRPLRPARRR